MQLRASHTEPAPPSLPTWNASAPRRYTAVQQPPCSATCGKPPAVGGQRRASAAGASCMAGVRGARLEAAAQQGPRAALACWMRGADGAPRRRERNTPSRCSGVARPRPRQ